MELGLSGKNALVTGSSYGLGFACAKILAQEGANVAICSRVADKAQVTANELAKSSTGKTIGIGADLTKEEDLERLVLEAVSGIGNIDILVVSTGHPPTYPFSLATDAHWKEGSQLVLRPAIVS